MSTLLLVIVVAGASMVVGALAGYYVKGVVDGNAFDELVREISLSAEAFEPYQD